MTRRQIALGIATAILPTLLAACATQPKPLQGQFAPITELSVDQVLAAMRGGNAAPAGQPDRVVRPASSGTSAGGVPTSPALGT